MPRNPTPAQIEAARRNGARSRGPQSAAGKARSARNATKHGLTSRNLTLPDAPPEYLQSFLDVLRPTNAAEQELVTGIANASSQIRWCWAREHALYGDQSPIEALRKNHAALAVIWSLESRCQFTKERLFRQLTQQRLMSQNQRRQFKSATAGLHNHDNEPKPFNVTNTSQRNRPKQAQATTVGPQNCDNEPKPFNLTNTNQRKQPEQAQATTVGPQNCDNEPKPFNLTNTNQRNQPEQAQATSVGPQNCDNEPKPFNLTNTSQRNQPEQAQATTVGPQNHDNEPKSTTTAPESRHIRWSRP